MQFPLALAELQQFMATRHNAIPVMHWEIFLAAQIGLSIDQFRFMVALLASVPAGAAVRLFKSPTARHLYATVIGFILVYYPFGFGVIHAVGPSVLVYLSVLLAPSSCGALAWLICFPYLIYLHVVNASGSNWQLGLLDFTGCEMVLVLKLIAFAVARQDHWQSKKNSKVLSHFQSQHALEAAPGPLQYLSFIFGLGNLLSGPYIEYVDYRNFMELKGTWAPESKAPKGGFMHALKCMANAVVYMALYQFLSSTCNRDLVMSGWYNNQSFVVKLLSCYLVSFTCQTKFVFAWKISEASLSVAGLNFKGWDEASGVAKWGRYENVRMETMLLSDSARLVVSHWNIGTANFLRRYVYERLTPAGRKSGFLQLLATQLVSAVWHGLYPGYLLFFAGSAFWLNFATVLYKAEKLLPARLQNSLPLKVIKILWTHLVLNYIATTFLVLDFKDCLRVWASLYYVPVIIIVVGSVLGPLLLSGAKKDRKQAGNKPDI